jgi:penicillin-binding protein 1B
MRLRRVVVLPAAAIVAALLITLAVYSSVELERFSRAEVRRTTFIYAGGQPLGPGVNVRLVDLAGTLSRLQYTETTSTPRIPGQFRRTSYAWELFLRGPNGPPGRDSRLIRLELRGERIARVTRDGRDVGTVTLEEEVLTSAGDRQGEDYRPIRLAEAPPVLLAAILAAEDHRFFEHRGLDLRGLARAAWMNTRAGKVTQGGSTITQQLVKNRLLTAERTLARKLNEAWLATVIEWRYSKDDILEAYLNEVYLGQRGGLAIRGLGAAARVYFRKEVHQLTLGESAQLAGMIRAPNSYSPSLDPDRARRRRDVVLARMRELGKISALDLAEAHRETVRVHAAPGAGQMAAYFSDYVRQELEEHFGDDFLSGPRPARVYTTLDMTLQRFAERALIRGLDRLETRFPRLRRRDPAERLQAALIALDPASGEVRALVGGRDYQLSQFNRATRAHRQPGSAFKPFVFLAALALREGRASFTAASFVDDSPITLTVGGVPWTPRNHDDRYEGRVTVRQAFERSLNSATIRLAQAVGLPAVIRTARSLGLESRMSPVPAIALGAFEVTPMELARAYLPLANGGERPGGPAVIRAVYPGGGPQLIVGGDEPARVISPAEAYLMTSLMQGVIDAGTASAVRAWGVTGDVAGKTGTTNDGRDAWFLGYSSRLLTLVWVGFDGGEAHGLSASEAAVPIWADFMKQAVEAYPAPPFVVPSGITVTEIDTTNGTRANRFCPLVARDAFLTGTEPPPCEEHGGAADRALDLWKRLRNWLWR